MVFGSIKASLLKTHNALMNGISSAFGATGIGAASLEGMEEALISADIGASTAVEITEILKSGRYSSEDALKEKLRDTLTDMLKPAEAPLNINTVSRPFVMMVLGVNGVGKTTTIGKLARYFVDRKKSVLIGAGDTFRAAAIEQLDVWGKRAGCSIIKHSHGADPAAVAFDSVKAAASRNSDVLILDTAGRLHTKTNLMEELKKIKRVVEREMPGAPHENLLILDASTGQNALNQAKLFNEAVGVTGIVITKLDGTAKGGIAVPIARELKIPIRFIGVGEGEDDLKEFYARDYAEALV